MYHVRLEVSRMVLLRIHMWDVTPCHWVVFLSLGVQEESMVPAAVEDEGTTFL